MNLTTVPTFTATIYVGFKDRESGRLVDDEYVESLVQSYVDSVGLCASYTKTKFIYTNGSEPGCVIGLINYPRFPSTPEAIKQHALKLAEILLFACLQFKVSVVMPQETIMLSSREG